MIGLMLFYWRRAWKMRRRTYAMGRHVMPVAYAKYRQRGTFLRGTAMPGRLGSCGRSSRYEKSA